MDADVQDGAVGNMFPLDAADNAILKSMEPAVGAIARIFGPYCEVLLHALDDLSHSVRCIANGHITGRTIGSPITEFAMHILRDSRKTRNQIFGPYPSMAKDGRQMRSITAVIHNQNERPIGMLCINMDLSAPFIDIVGEFLRHTMDADKGPKEQFASSVEELISRSLDEVHTALSRERQLSPVARNKRIVSELNQRGIFEIKGIIEYVAKEMGLSKYTIYNYLREVKQEEQCINQQ